MTRTIIGVFCYKRAGKLKRVMEALLQNPECPDMEIIFFSDGFKGEHDREGVERTRAYIDSLTGFKKIHKHYRDRNFSTGPNFETGLRYLADNYDQFIIVEDDLIVSPNYIRFMLDGLEQHRNDKDVFSISGYCFPIMKRDYPYDTFIHERFCCYGWSSWSDRVKKVIWEKEKLQDLMDTKAGFKRKLDREGLDLYRTLRKQVDGTISTWDVQMQVAVAENNMKVVYPTLSKTTNIGFDNESTNTFGLDYLKTKIDSGENRSFQFCDVGIKDRQLLRQVRKPYEFRALATRKIINTFIKLTAQVKKAQD